MGGAITFTSGSGTGNGNGGNISFRPGLGSGSGINGQIVLGNGDGGTPSNTTIRGAAASGTNVAGADLYFDASNGTGTGGSGSFLFRTAPATGPSYVTTGSTTFFSTSGNLSYTVAAGSNRLLVVGVSVPSGNVNSVSSVTFGGQALTNLTTVTSAGTDRPRVEIWYLKEAGITAAIGVSGTANITVTVNTTLDIVFGATNYTNVDQTTSFGTAVTNSGTDTNPTVNVSTSTEDIVFDTMHKCNTGVCGSATVTVGAPPQTQRWNTSTGNTHGSASTKPGNGGTVTMNWTLNNSRSWAIAAVPIKGTTTGQTNTLEERLKISQSGIYISGPATGSTYGLCFDCDGTFGNATVQNGIAWGTDSTITNNLFAYRSGNGQYTLSDGAGTILLQASTSQFTLNLDNTTSFTERLCHNGSNGATTAQRIGDCQSSGQADFAEYYGSFENLEPGEVIVTNGEASQFDHETLGHVSKAFVGKSTQTYQKELIGVVSTNPFSEILSSDIFAENENPVPVALSGRVPVKVSTENGPIEPGDPLTSSSTPGVAMKATQAGPIIGKSLESYSNSDPNVVEKIIVFVEAGYFTPQIAVNETTLTGLENISTNDLIAVNISASSLIVSDSINIGDKITMNKDGKLTVNGEIIIAGKITLTGDIFISGKVSAKTVAAEEFQVKSTEEGNDKTAGVATVIAGTDELVINSTKVDDTSLVFVTPTKQTNLQLAVVEKLAGTSFKVKLNALATEDVSFNWLIVNQQISQGN